MKRFEFSIDTEGADWFFSAIRSKADVIILLMHSIKWMLLNIEIPKEKAVGRMILTSAKMNRLFFEREGKYFSLAFPFFFQKDNGGLRFYTNSVELIDARVTSQIISLIRDSELLGVPDFYNFVDPVDELIKNDEGLWALLRSLMVFEDGYIRYDHDPDRVDKEPGSDKHPLHHLDIFYTTPSTFKVGLKKTISMEALLDMLDIQTNCSYLHPRAS